MGITSHKISSLYPHILNSMRHCLLTITFYSFCNHETLHGFVCAVVSNSNFSTISMDTKLSVIPLSIITLHSLYLLLQAFLDKFFFCTAFSTSIFVFKKTFLNIMDIPSSIPFASIFSFYTSKM
jgi:hypothetical protein